MIHARLDRPAGIAAVWVKRVVARTLKSERSKAGVEVLVTSDRRIRSLNQRFLNHDHATDVISFGMDERNYLGDLVVSAETARRVAKELGVPYKEELARYLIHGTLHLLGYDDKKKKDFKKMHDRQEAILERMKKSL